ncbi:MAG: hypothetical protein COA75_03020 [Cellvibrionales bacterium]|nr:MAG: hypothetical protein COA75_03020 [Cellvibrionales bacterium]
MMISGFIIGWLRMNRAFEVKMLNRLPSFIAIILLMSCVSASPHTRLNPIEDKHYIYKYQLTIDGLPNLDKAKSPPEIQIMARQENTSKPEKEMTAEKRKRLKERRKHFEALPAEEKQRLKEARKKFKQLPPEERKRLRQKWQNLSPEQRDKAIKKKQKNRQG